MKPLLNVTRWIRWAFFALAAVLLASSLFLIVNTIRLATFARRREIEVMKLVGASNWFVRVPFMAEGLRAGRDRRRLRGRARVLPEVVISNLLENQHNLLQHVLRRRSPTRSASASLVLAHRRRHRHARLDDRPAPLPRSAEPASSVLDREHRVGAGGELVVPVLRFGERARARASRSRPRRSARTARAPPASRARRGRRVDVGVARREHLHERARGSRRACRRPSRRSGRRRSRGRPASAASSIATRAGLALLRACVKRREPAVGEAADAAQLRRRLAAEPHVERLRGLRQHGHAPRSGTSVPSWSTASSVHRRRSSGSASSKIDARSRALDAERLLLDRVHDAEPERGQRPPAREHVERRPLLRDERRAAAGQHRHARAELDLARCAPPRT